MARPFTRQQALQNQAFLEALERTGNIRLAARRVGIPYGTIQHRRRTHPAFAQEIDAALAFAAARLNAEGGLRRPGAAPAGDSPHRTQGGEAVVVRRRDGKLQMRAAQPGKLTRQCEQAFLAALGATANVRLSAAAAGASEAAFYRRRRQNPAFAREMRLALQQGYDRLELALMESWSLGSHHDDAWRHNAPPALPPMTVNQALQLLYLHQKEARLLAEPAHIRRRRGESREAHSARLGAMHEERLRRDREAYDIAEMLRDYRGEAPMFAPAPLPDLAQVKGWSKARRRAEGEAEPDRALFGGWRIAEMKGRTAFVAPDSTGGPALRRRERKRDPGSSPG